MSTISRKIPQTQKGVQNALNMALNQMGIVAPTEMMLTADTQAKVTAMAPAFDGVMSDKKVALYQQTKATKAAQAAFKIVVMFISHFFQVFNLGIARGKYQAEERAFFEIDINSKVIPALGTEANVMAQGKNVHDGDALRMAEAGAVAMANPTTAEVDGKFGDWKTKNNLQNLKISDYENKSSAVVAMFDAALAVVVKVWDEGDAYYDDKDAPAKRAKLRPWGVIYEGSETMTIRVKIKNSITKVGIEGAESQIVETGENRLSDADGNLVLTTKVIDEVNLHTQMDGYNEQDTVVTFEAGVTEYTIEILLVPVA